MQPFPSRRAARFVAVWPILAGLCFGAIEANAQPATSPGGAWTVTLENDKLTGSDNNYSNGIGLSWVSKPIDTYDEHSFVGRWGRSFSFLPFVGKDGFRTYVSWSLAHEMHTPDDITVRNPPLDDQPYAGIVYIDSAIYA